MGAVFESFWTFVGTVILLVVVFEGTAGIVSAWRGRKAADEGDEQ